MPFFQHQQCSRSIFTPESLDLILLEPLFCSTELMDRPFQSRSRWIAEDKMMGSCRLKLMWLDYLVIISPICNTVLVPYVFVCLNMSTVLLFLALKSTLTLKLFIKLLFPGFVINILHLPQLMHY